MFKNISACFRGFYQPSRKSENWVRMSFICTLNTTPRAPLVPTTARSATMATTVLAIVPEMASSDLTSSSKLTLFSSGSAARKSTVLWGDLEECSLLPFCNSVSTRRSWRKQFDGFQLLIQGMEYLLLLVFERCNANAALHSVSTLK